MIRISFNNFNNERTKIKPVCLLDHIEVVVDYSQRNGIDKCLVKEKKSLNYIAKKLDITPIQALLFSHFIEKSNEIQILLSEIATSLNCSTARIIKYMNECEVLAQKKLIRCSNDAGVVVFRVPEDVRNSIRKEDRFVPENLENLNINQFFMKIKRLYREKEIHELSHASLAADIKELINLNTHLYFCQKIKTYNLCDDDLVFFMCICHLWVNNHDDHVCFAALDFILDEEDWVNQFTATDFHEGTHSLFEMGYIEFSNSKGFVDNESFHLTNKVKKELLPEIKGRELNYKRELKGYDTIQAKELFYNEKEARSIQTLTNLLGDKSYKKILERLEQKGMRKGFACLFSGAPGTGKTETAYQVAKQTGRDIMLIDIAETKSMWYGESEKKIKEIFSTYRTAVERSEVTPILLFNEADGVISKRKISNSANASIDETENRIQNIILQEIENLEGILIATTNLTANMDKAFERRFLYKIEFEKPCLKARKSIWHSMMQEFDDATVEELATSFDLTGGQIENIARKVAVDSVLYGKDPSMDTLQNYCKEELAGTNRKVLGFV
ncbi:MAG: ATP-binding protein [Spirochaetaceae bacterium]|jgi:SpoVK/Ycf46/Vps4 family AAA+-type ATPase|nr:ATP-binding protein [Spirochaetaceae bacterium]